MFAYARRTDRQRGNVAMMFGILLIPMLAAVGVALDYYRLNDTRASISEAIDAGLLAAARAKMTNPTLSDAAAEKLAEQVFKAETTGIAGLTLNSLKFSYDKPNDTFSVTVDADLKALILQVVGRDEFDINMVAEAKTASPRPLEVVLALDSTDSMAGDKLASLKTAANDLVNSIMSPAADNKVLVGVVPFSRHVNIGVSRRWESWLDIEPDSFETVDSCTVDNAAASAEGCYEQGATCYDDGVAYACTEWVCPDGDDAPENCTTANQKITWLGCLGSRTPPLNVQDQDFNTDPVPGQNNWDPWPDCPSEITPMTTTRSTVTSAINKMTTQGETYIPSGLTWALRLISNEAPFTEGMAYSDIKGQLGVKAIVLMTDGKNTASLSGGATGYGGHYGDDEAYADEVTKDACDEIKSKEVALYTIAFEVTDTATINLLKACATDSNSFFDAKDSVDLAAAFDSIANSLIELALTK